MQHIDAVNLRDRISVLNRLGRLAEMPVHGSRQGGIRVLL